MLRQGLLGEASGFFGEQTTAALSTWQACSGSGPPYPSNPTAPLLHGAALASLQDAHEVPKVADWSRPSCCLGVSQARNRLRAEQGVFGRESRQLYAQVGAEHQNGGRLVGYVGREQDACCMRRTGLGYLAGHAMNCGRCVSGDRAGCYMGRGTLGGIGLSGSGGGSAPSPAEAAAADAGRPAERGGEAGGLGDGHRGVQRAGAQEALPDRVREVGLPEGRRISTCRLARCCGPGNPPQSTGAHGRLPRAGCRSPEELPHSCRQACQLAYSDACERVGCPRHAAACRNLALGPLLIIAVVPAWRETPLPLC